MGTGGASKNVDGIDMWMEGTPPRKFLIIGVINDSRPGRGIAMLLRDGHIAAMAKEKGGDAVLLRFEETEHVANISNSTSFTSGSASAYTSGTANAYKVGNNINIDGRANTQIYGSSSTSTTGVTQSIIRKHTKVYVVKYL